MLNLWKNTGPICTMDSKRQSAKINDSVCPEVRRLGVTAIRRHLINQRFTGNPVRVVIMWNRIDSRQNKRFQYQLERDTDELRSHEHECRDTLFADGSYHFAAQRASRVRISAQRGLSVWDSSSLVMGNWLTDNRQPAVCPRCEYLFPAVELTDGRIQAIGGKQGCPKCGKKDLKLWENRKQNHPFPSDH